MPLLRIALLTCLAVGLIVACAPKPTPDELPAGAAPGQVQLLLHRTAKPAVLEAAFSTVALRTKGPSSRTENRWIFTFDATQTSTSELLRQLRAHAAVLEADHVLLTTN